MQCVSAARAGSGTTPPELLAQIRRLSDGLDCGCADAVPDNRDNNRWNESGQSGAVGRSV